MPKMHKVWHRYLDWHTHNITYACNWNTLLYRDWTNGKDGIVRATMNNFEVTCKNCQKIINRESDFAIRESKKWGESYFLTDYDKSRIKEEQNAKHLQ